MADELKAESAQGSEKAEGGDAAKAGLPIIPFMLAMVVAVVLSVGSLGGAALWMVKSGRLGGGGPVKVEAAEKKEDVLKTKLIALDPLLVNLADADGKGYLRVTIVLKVEDPPPAKGEKPKEEEKPEKGKVVVNENEVMLRDTALNVIGRQTGDGLLAAEGKERLKTQLHDAMSGRLPKLKVVDVMLTEFLVQR